MLVAQYSLQQLQTAFGPFLVKNFRLPYGGPTGTGGKFARGTVLGCVAGTVQSEVATLTVSGTAAHVSTFTADKAYVVSHAYNASLATAQTAWEAVFGAGNVLVGGTAGTTYTLTFQNQLANTRMGGLFSTTATGGTPTWARTTRGSSGAGQYDAYVDGTVDPAAAVLAMDYLSSPLGELVSEGVRSGQPFSPLCYVAAFLNAADLTGLDANAVADRGWRIAVGGAITDTGAVVALGY